MGEVSESVVQSLGRGMFVFVQDPGSRNKRITKSDYVPFPSLNNEKTVLVFVGVPSESGLLRENSKEV